jgi:hypothetical protein
VNPLEKIIIIDAWVFDWVTNDFSLSFNKSGAGSYLQRFQILYIKFNFGQTDTDCELPMEKRCRFITIPIQQRYVGLNGNIREQRKRLVSITTDGQVWLNYPFRHRFYYGKVCCHKSDFLGLCFKYAIPLFFQFETNL